ncbi:hypothetical protein EV363DRAFT_1586671 [Boletus edulis]|nr:hypothetical protein EV363DRAFT_1586671 [Boletus edulis]
MQPGELLVADRVRAELNQFARPAIEEEKVLIRNEYRIALQTLQTDAYERGAYVTGHPGIGRFAAASGAHFSVQYPALQGYAIFTDTVAFYPVTDITPLISGDRVWALSDSLESYQSLPRIFYSDLDYTLPIQVTSPKKERWHHWSKQACAKCYVMDIWTEQEIANLAQLLGLDGGRMISLHKKWGGPVSLLRSYLETSDQQIEMGYSWEAGLAIKKCRSTITSIMGNNLPEDAPSQFFFCRP